MGFTTRSRKYPEVNADVPRNTNFRTLLPVNGSAAVPVLPVAPRGRGEASAPMRVCRSLSSRRGSGPAPRGGFGEVPAARGRYGWMRRQQVKGPVDGRIRKGGQWREFAVGLLG